jgi:hypothetical protein
MGLRFLALDRASVLRIEDYVYQRAGRIEAEPPPTPGEPE